MSKKYIDHDAIMEQIVKIKDDFSPTVRPMFDVFKHILSEAPTADVAPVVHGEWIDDLYAEKCGDAYCSECNHFDWSNLNYCPNCGARMDGGKK